MADFNFDGLEDVAIKRFENQNAIPKYTFYIQVPDCKGFKSDLFLTYEVAYLPDQIDYQNKTLYVNICKSKMEYKNYSNLQKWRIVDSNYASHNRLYLQLLVPGNNIYNYLLRNGRGTIFQRPQLTVT